MWQSYLAQSYLAPLVCLLGLFAYLAFPGTRLSTAGLVTFTPTSGRD